MSEQGIAYEVRRVPSKTAKDYLRKNHYSRSCHNGPSPCYGLFEGDRMIGCLAYATPCSENVRAWAQGPDKADETIELHRLFIEDTTPKNTETWFIAQTLRLLLQDRPQTRIVVSFSDTTEGHVGTIYAAANFVKTGHTGRARFYRDPSGSLRHPRQNGVNISPEEAKRRGWVPEMREAKARWHYPLGRSKSERRRLRKLLEEKAHHAD